MIAWVGQIKILAGLKMNYSLLKGQKTGTKRKTVLYI